MHITVFLKGKEEEKLCGSLVPEFKQFKIKNHKKKSIDGLGETRMKLIKINLTKKVDL